MDSVMKSGLRRRMTLIPIDESGHAPRVAYQQIALGIVDVMAAN